MAGVYVVLTLILAPISFGPVQVRFAAGLNVLGAINPVFIFPLMLGTTLANFFGGLGILDIIIGPLATGAAATGCFLFRKQGELMPLAIPIFSSPILAGYLSLIFGLPFWVLFLQLFLGQAIAAYTLGVVIYEIFHRRANQWGPDFRILQKK